MKTEFNITTLSALRESFWEDHPEYRPLRRRGKRQNDYDCTIRSAFVEYVDALQKSGDILERLADRATL